MEIINYKKLVQNGAIILDVRSYDEFSAGHVVGSINIPLNLLPEQMSTLEDKNKVIITCCASGMRSASAKNILENAGYTQVYNAGGWMSLNGKF